MHLFGYIFEFASVYYLPMDNVEYSFILFFMRHYTLFKFLINISLFIPVG